MSRLGLRRFTVDLEPGDEHPPLSGDVIGPAASWPAGRAWYLVLSARPVESRTSPNRWELTCRRIAVAGRAPTAEEALAGGMTPGGRVHYWTPRS